jgi:hypothetical protein
MRRSPGPLPRLATTRPDTRGRLSLGTGGRLPVTRLGVAREPYAGATCWAGVARAGTLARLVGPGMARAETLGSSRSRGGSSGERGARLVCTGGRGAAALGPSLTAGAPPPHVLGAWASIFYLSLRTCPRGPPTVRLRASGGLRPACVPRWRLLARRADIVCAPLVAVTALSHAWLAAPTGDECRLRLPVAVTALSCTMNINCVGGSEMVDSTGPVDATLIAFATARETTKDGLSVRCAPTLTLTRGAHTAGHAGLRGPAMALGGDE